MSKLFSLMANIEIIRLAFGHVDLVNMIPVVIHKALDDIKIWVNKKNNRMSHGQDMSHYMSLPKFLDIVFKGSITNVGSKSKECQWCQWLMITIRSCGHCYCNGSFYFFPLFIWNASCFILPVLWSVSFPSSPGPEHGSHGVSRGDAQHPPAATGTRLLCVDG